ncbi:MAG: AzlD domain-containing protein [Clostridia bacterium]|nr:AzlD domain-containing protein [Clostridia bacterium]
MNIPLLIFGMALVTFIPRILPAFIVDKIKMNRYVERFLKLIPYTAMAALVFPGVIGVGGERWYIGAIGAVVAILLSMIPKIPSWVVIIVAVLSIFPFFI